MEHFLKTEDNEKIAFNFYQNNFKEVLIIAPGCFMTKDSRPFLHMSKNFAKHRDVICMDFRGHGNSSGFYTFSSKEVNEMKAIVDFARDKYEKVYLLGFSMGGALSLIHAAAHKNVDRVIAVSAPRRFGKLENQIWKKEAWMQTIKKFEWKRFFSLRPGMIGLFIRKKINPIDIIEGVDAPTLFIAGDKDPTVHAWHTKSLYDKALCEKKYELFENCSHAEDLFLQSTRRFITTCKNWLKES